MSYTSVQCNIVEKLVMEPIRLWLTVRVYMDVSVGNIDLVVADDVDILMTRI
jgi:hypothetical protein